MLTLLSSAFRLWPCGLSLIRRTAGCGPACPVVWQGRRGDPLPYADCSCILYARVAATEITQGAKSVPACDFNERRSDREPLLGWQICHVDSRVLRGQEGIRPR